MKQLLKLEFRKLKKQKSFYICTLIMAALLFLSALTANVLSHSSAVPAGQLPLSGIQSMLQALNNSSFLLITAIFVAITVCDDYEQQTIKHIYARGYSRRQTYLSKLILIWVSTTIMFAVVMLAAFGFGTLYFGAGDTAGLRFFGVIAAQYLACMANAALFFLVSALLRKNGSAIAAAIVAPMVVNMLLALADSFFKWNKYSLTGVWISSFLNDLSVLNVSSERLAVCLAASLAYVLLFTAVGLHFHKKLEL